jgi:hypothetical protein
MSWTGDMQGSIMREMMSKEKRRKAGRPVGGGLKMVGNY